VFCTARNNSKKDFSLQYVGAVKTEPEVGSPSRCLKPFGQNAGDNVFSRDQQTDSLKHEQESPKDNGPQDLSGNGALEKGISISCVFSSRKSFSSRLYNKPPF